MSAENPPNLPVPAGPRGIVEKKDTLPEIGVTRLSDEESVPHTDEEIVASPNIIDAEFSPIEYKKPDGDSDESEAQPTEEEKALERVRNVLGLINESISTDDTNDPENAPSKNTPDKDEVIFLRGQGEKLHAESAKETAAEGDPAKNHESKPGDHDEEHKKGGGHEKNHDDHDNHHKHGKHEGHHGHHESKPMGKKEIMIGNAIFFGGLAVVGGLGEQVLAPVIVGWLGLSPVVSAALAGAGMAVGWTGIFSFVALSFGYNLLKSTWEELKTNPPWKGIVKLGGGGGGGKKKSGGGGGHAPAGGDHH